MIYVLYVLLGLALFAVVLTLVMGGAAMSKQNTESRIVSNKWMMRRVVAQGIALCLLAIILMVKRTGG